MIDVLGLEERGFNAWPAPRNVYFGGWVFRLGGGYTKRANSANALGDRREMRAESINAWTPARDFREVMAQAERFYAANGQPTIFRLTPLAGPDADPLLAAAGYEALDPSSVMTAPLDAARPDARIELAPGPTPAWLNGIAAAQGVAPSHRLIHERIVQAIALPAAFATACVGDRAAGFGLAVLDRGAVGLFDIVVRPEHRGAGVGRALTCALMAFGRAEGAKAAYLQVFDANIVARGLYERLGFRAAYPYHYRRCALTSAPALRR
jgi:ribosomal protein S18 acetylase RimI-like enzyme